jgi:phosphatidylglycerophosphatase A
VPGKEHRIAGISIAGAREETRIAAQNRVATILATAGYVGYAPVAPGTFGSAAGLVVYAAVAAANSVLVEALVIAAVLIAGIWSAGWVEQECGKDPGVVVIDEVLGMLVTLAFLDVTITGAIAGFFVFRVLDVWKPFPAGRFEHLHGGPGIMLDDVMAGIYGNVVLRLLAAAVPGTLT